MNTREWPVAGVIKATCNASFGAGEVRVTRASSCCFMACFVSQDAHNCMPGMDDETAMFAVYDGHGGNVYSTQRV